MAHSKAAEALRRCTATTASGRPCKAWAVWDDDRQLCNVHAGRHYRAELRPDDMTFEQIIAHEERRAAAWLERLINPRPTNYTPCDCAAYSWPHRPGGGLCRWPDPPESRGKQPAGTHGDDRLSPTAPWQRGDPHPPSLAKLVAKAMRRAQGRRT